MDDMFFKELRTLVKDCSKFYIFSHIHPLESSLGRVQKWSAISMKIHMRYLHTRNEAKLLEILHFFHTSTPLNLPLGESINGAPFR